MQIGATNYCGVKGLRNANAAGVKAWGILYSNSDVGFADITDGTSNTFAVGERRQDGGANAGVWPGMGNGSTGDGANNTGIVLYKLNGTSNPDKAFSSEHPGQTRAPTSFWECSTTVCRSRISRAG